ncbi:MAG: glycosyltransferase, partial [Rhodovibrionaceae bacterium]
EFPALSETFVLNQVTGLIDQGHDVTVFAERPRPEPQVHADVQRYGLQSLTRYPKLPGNLAHRGLRAFGLAARVAGSNPLRLASCLDVRRFGREAASGRLLYWGACLAREKPFDIVLAHFGPVGQLAATLRDAGLLQGKLATVMHGVDVSAYLKEDRDAYRDLFDKGELFLPISEVWRDKLLELGCPAEKAAVHHMGVDTARYRYLPRRRAADAPLKLLTVGRLVEKKGVADALRALARMLEAGQDARYRIIGDGPLRQELEELRDALGLQEQVRFLGWREQQSVIGQMQDCDILLAPSVTTESGDQEGIPVTLMEAMASGMIVVSTWHSGIPELVEDGVSGLLVEEGDTEALTAALLRLARSDVTSWTAFSEAARARVLEAFDVTRLNLLLTGRFNGLLMQQSAAA